MPCLLALGSAATARNHKQQRQQQLESDRQVTFMCGGEMPCLLALSSAAVTEGIHTYKTSSSAGESATLADDVQCGREMLCLLALSLQ
jgi:hypothetical protein